MSLANDFVRADFHVPGGILIPIFQLRAGPPPAPVSAEGRNWEIGYTVGQVLFAKGIPGAKVPHSLEASVWIKFIGSEFSLEDEHVNAILDLGSGRIRLCFRDESSVELRSRADEVLESRESIILRHGVTFVGESGTAYVVGPEIGRGGTAIVHLARSSSQTYAVKCLHASRFDPDDVTPRFEREVRSLASLESPNVLGYIDHAYGGRHLVLVSELASHSLSDRLQAGPPIRSVGEDWIESLLAGLDAMHIGGMLHRDVSPRNVVFVGNTLKVADLGATRMEIDADLTARVAGLHLGSLIYASAEQRHDPHNARAADDVFSAGQVAYQILTGIVPIGNPPSLDEFKQIPFAIRRVINQMRAYRREDRFVDAGEALKVYRAARKGRRFFPSA